MMVFIYMMVCYGIANTIIYANGPFHCFVMMHKVAKWIHPQLDEMLSCFICSGWWIGFGMSALNMLAFPWAHFTPMSMFMLPTEYWYVTVFLDGAFVSASNWILNNAEEALERSNADG